MEELDRVAADIDDHDVWFRQKVTGGLRQLDRGEFLTHEEVGTRLKKAFQP